MSVTVYRRPSFDRRWYRAWFVPSAAAATAQLLAPSTDSVDGNWTNELGSTTNLYDSIDEVYASDSDYIQSELSPSASGTRVKLASGSDPGSSTGHKINWRTGKSATGGDTIDMTVKLYQGGSNVLGAGTLVADFDRAAVDSLTTYTETLSGGEADTITDYADLYLEFYATVHDDEFGYHVIGANVNANGGEYMLVSKEILSTSITITKLACYVAGSTSGSEHIRAIVYTDSSGTPGSLVASGTDITALTAGIGPLWFDLPFSSPVNLTAATYWIGYHFGQGAVGFNRYSDTVTNNLAYLAGAFILGPVDPFGTPGGFTNERLSVYGT